MASARDGKTMRGVLLLAWRGAAATLAAIPFVPTITWYSGSFESGARESISFASALLMHLTHEHDHGEGMALFVFPSIAGAASFVVSIEDERLRRAIGAGSLAIGAWELFLATVHADGYGTAFYTIAGWFGIQAMIPEDRYLAHAATVALAGLAMLVIDLLAAPGRSER